MRPCFMEWCCALVVKKDARGCIVHDKDKDYVASPAPKRKGGPFAVKLGRRR